MNFLNGTYGFDLLSIFLILVGAILNMFNATYLLGILLSIYAIYRAFSKNHYMRKKEFDFFRFYSNKILSKFGKSLPDNLPSFNLNNLNFVIAKVQNWLYQRQHFKITKCPSCKQKLRLPRGKGKVVVTCKKCLTKFDLKT